MTLHKNDLLVLKMINFRLLILTLLYVWNESGPTKEMGGAARRRSVILHFFSLFIHVWIDFLGKGRQKVARKRKEGHLRF